MTPTDPILSSVTAAAACSFLLDLAQKSKLVPWISAHTKSINLAAKLVLSAVAAIGISYAWTPATGGGGSLMIGIPSLTVILLGLWHWFGQFALQHGFGQVLSIGTVTKIDAPAVQASAVKAEIEFKP